MTLFVWILLGLVAGFQFSREPHGMSKRSK
jgi:hypothetical protein